jgi:hypothetical protein
MLEIIVAVLLAGLSGYGAAATRMIWPGPSCRVAGFTSTIAKSSNITKGATRVSPKRPHERP